jgi:hypothetical protein
MIDGAKRVPYHRMARSIREELREQNIKNAKDVDAFFNTIATNFLADVSQFRSSVDGDFRSVFPNLYKDLIEYIKTCIDHSSSELFREHVSGESVTSGPLAKSMVPKGRRYSNLHLARRSSDCPRH